MTEMKTVVAPVRFPEVFDEKMNKARARFIKDKKEIVAHHFTADGGILMCVFEIKDKDVRRRPAKTKAGEA